jgi:predicted nuclease of predicted toxin-antitoxin system
MAQGSTCVLRHLSGAIAAAVDAEKRGSMPSRNVAVVDAANVAHEEVSQGGKPKIGNLMAVRDRLRELGYEPIVIADASLRHEIDDPDQFESLLEKQEFRQVPAGTDADYFIVQTAEQQDALIISNDRYKDFEEQHPWVGDRRVPFMIVKGQVQLYEDRLPAPDLRDQPVLR